eukprot:4249424-Alexandrium_andersonii.AAC.1
MPRALVQAPLCSRPSCSFQLFLCALEGLPPPPSPPRPSPGVSRPRTPPTGASGSPEAPVR